MEYRNVSQGEDQGEYSVQYIENTKKGMMNSSQVLASVYAFESASLCMSGKANLVGGVWKQHCRYGSNTWSHNGDSFTV